MSAFITTIGKNFNIFFFLLNLFPKYYNTGIGKITFTTLDNQVCLYMIFWTFSEYSIIFKNEYAFLKFITSSIIHLRLNDKIIFDWLTLICRTFGFG